MENIRIEEVKELNRAMVDLLLEADPSIEAVSDYTKRGNCYVVMNNNIIAGICVLLPTRPFTIELVNISIREEYQSKGLGKMMVSQIIRIAKDKSYRVMEVGTGNAGIMQLAFYQKCGFTITWIDLDFFTKHYPDKIVENGIECKDMVRMRLDLI